MPGLSTLTKPRNPRRNSQPTSLPHEDFNPIVEGRPFDFNRVALGNNLAAKNKSGNINAIEESIRTQKRSDFPCGTTTLDDVDGTEVLVTEVTGRPGASTGGSRRDGRIELGLLRPAYGRGRVIKVKDELAVVGSPFLVDLEGYQGADVGAAVCGATADYALRRVEGNSTGFGVELAGEIRVDGGDRIVGSGDQRGGVGDEHRGDERGN